MLTSSNGWCPSIASSSLDVCSRSKNDARLASGSGAVIRLTTTSEATPTPRAARKTLGSQ